MLIEDKLLENFVGGANWSLFAGIGMLIAFVAGIVDGYMRPLKCN